MRINVLDVEFDNITMDEAVAAAMAHIQNRDKAVVVTPNPEIVMAAREDRALADMLHRADLVLADGVGIIYGAKLLGTPLKSKIPGIDFAAEVMQRLAGQGGSIFLLGAKPGVAEAAGENLLRRFPGLVLAGTHDGYFRDDRPVIEAINAAKPDMLFVCLGCPKQEKWMFAHQAELDVGLMAGLGGSLDVFAGVAQRAPAAFQKTGMEWFYRLCKDPRRIGRMMKLPQFLLLVAGRRMGGKNDASAS